MIGDGAEPVILLATVIGFVFFAVKFRKFQPYICTSLLFMFQNTLL